MIARATSANGISVMARPDNSYQMVSVTPLRRCRTPVCRELGSRPKGASPELERGRSVLPWEMEVSTKMTRETPLQLGLSARTHAPL